MFIISFSSPKEATWNSMKTAPLCCLKATCMKNLKLRDRDQGLAWVLFLFFMSEPRD